MQAAHAVELLKASAGDKGLTINVLALLGALAEAGPEAAQALVDALCKVIASGPGPKDVVATKASRASRNDGLRHNHRALKEREGTHSLAVC